MSIYRARYLNSSCNALKRNDFAIITPPRHRRHASRTGKKPGLLQKSFFKVLSFKVLTYEVGAQNNDSAVHEEYPVGLLIYTSVSHRL